MSEDKLTQFHPVTIQANKDRTVSNVIYHMQGTGGLVVWNREHRVWLYIVGERSEYIETKEVRLLFNNVRDKMLKIAKERQWTNITPASFFGSKEV